MNDIPAVPIRDIKFLNNYDAIINDLYHFMINNQVSEDGLVATIFTHPGRSLDDILVDQEYLLYAIDIDSEIYVMAYPLQWKYILYGRFDKGKIVKTSKLIKEIQSIF